MTLITIENSDLKPPKQLYDVADAIGNFMEYWGFKKIHGKVWTLIFLADEPVNANYLIEKLGVSKSLVSMTLKELHGYNVITETEKTTSTVTYVANKDIYSVIVDVLLDREAKLLSEVKGLAENLKVLPNERLNPYAKPKRINDLIKMTHTADKIFKAIVNLKKLDLRLFKSSLKLEETSH